MTMTRINQQIGQLTVEDDCLVVALISDALSDAITALLHGLKAELGDALWGMPEGSRHITLCEIIQSKEYVSDKQPLFDKLEDYKHVLRKTLGMKPFTITFNRVEASEDAIIIKGYDSGEFRTIRDSLVKGLPLPSETRQPPDIIHSTIARYKGEVDLNYVKQIVRKHNISFSEHISEFQLLTHTVPHLINFTLEERYKL